MEKTEKYTPGPWVPSDIGFLTNEGQRPIMAGPREDRKRVALVDCQTPFKRGQGYKTECAEREANARLIAAGPDLVAVVREILAIYSADTPANLPPGMLAVDLPWVQRAKAALSKAGA